MLVVLLLLTPLVSDGLVMPKCEVVDQLMSNIPADVKDHDNVVAEIACHAEVTSNFNTSLVKQVSSPDFFGKRTPRSATKKKNPKTNTHPKTTHPPTNPITTPHPKTMKNLNAHTTTLPPKYQNATNEPMINQTKPTMPPQYNHSHTDPPSNHSHILTHPPSNHSHTDPPSNHSHILTHPPSNQSHTDPPSNHSHIDPPSNHSHIDPPSNHSHTDPPSNHSHIDPPSNHSHTDPPSNQSHIDPPSNHSQTKGGMPPPPPPNFNFSNLNYRKKRDAGELWTLYGVFQLADRFACTSPGKPSLNICNLSCDKLIDDDITDDINCVLTIINRKSNINTNPVGQDQSNSLISTLKDKLLNTCHNMDYTQYLAQCNNQ